MIYSESWSKINLWIIKVGFFAIAFIPLYVSRSLFFPYITGKAFVFRTIVELAFFLWLWLAFYFPEYRLRKTPVLISLSVFLVIISLAAAFGVNAAKSFWSNFERMEGLIAHLHLFAFFLVAAHVFRRKDWLIFFNLFVLSSFFENFYVLLQGLGRLPSPQGGIRADGTIGNPTYLAGYLIFLLGFALLLWLQSKNRWVRYYYVFAILFTLLSIYFTASRGPTLGILIAGFLGLLAYLFWKRPTTAEERRIKAIIFGALILLVVLPITAWVWRETNFIKNNPTLSRLTSLSFTERTITSRFSIWSMSFEGAKERPILGWGLENYPIVFSKYFRPQLWNQEPWFDRSHNIVLDWLIHAGVLGLAAYLSIFVSIFWLFRKACRQNLISLEWALVFSGILIAYFIQNVFVFDNLATYIGFFSIAAYVQSLFVDIRKEGRRFVVPPDSVLVIPGLLSVILFFSIWYLVNWKPLQANLNLLNGMRGGDSNQVFSYFDKALSYSTLGDTEIRENLLGFAIQVGGNNQLSPEFRDRVLRRTLKEFQQMVSENPLDPRAHLFLGILYSRIGFGDQALQVLNKALELSPKKQQIYFEIADVLVQNGKQKEAIDILREALDLDKSNGFARLNLAAILILSGQQKAADEFLVEGFGTVDPAEKILVQIYNRVGKYDRLVEVWKAFIKNQPDKFEYRRNLAETYFRLSQKTRAIFSIEEAARSNPDFKAEADAYLKEISSR